MKIGLIDIDGHNYPNLALMKLSAYHKSIGDEVEWAGLNNYDITYMSKVFTYTQDWIGGLGNYGEIIKGGTGYNMKSLPDYIDKLCPDYSIYPMFKEAYGFLTRGCPNKCPWCIVPHKEGKIKPYADIEDFLDGRKTAVLMDNNVLAHKHGIKQIEKIIKLGIAIDFNQGLDARLIVWNEDIAEMLGAVRWYKSLRMACDTKSQMQYIEDATKLLRKHGAKPQNYFVYVLVTRDIDDALMRVEFLRQLHLDPFAQPYIDFSGKNKITKQQRQFARWVNHKAIFKSVPYSKYIA